MAIDPMSQTRAHDAKGERIAPALERRTLRCAATAAVLFAVLRLLFKAQHHALATAATRLRQAILRNPHGAQGAALAMAAVIFYARRYLSLVCPPQLTYRKTAENERTVLQCREYLLRDAWPHPLAVVNGLVTTGLMGVRFSFALCGWIGCGLHKAARQELRLQDGGLVSLTWWREEVPAGTPIAIVFPGLNNCSSTGFVRQLMRLLDKRGFAACAMDYRGVGDNALLTPRMASADAWRDYPAVFDHVRAEHPGSKIFAIGQSLGGCTLLKYLGESGEESEVDAAVAVSAPVDMLGVSSYLLSRSFLPRFASFVAALPLKILYMTMSRVRLEEVSTGEVLRAASLHDIDGALVCPCNGYQDWFEYYEKNTPLPTLHHISAPTLLVHASDDPIIPPTDTKEVEKNEKLIYAEIPWGGHLAFQPWRPLRGLFGCSWADELAIEFLAHHAWQPEVEGTASEPDAPRRRKSRIEFEADGCSSTELVSPKARQHPGVRGWILGA